MPNRFINPWDKVECHAPPPSEDLSLIAEINVTNLIDTAFILLIGFMLVAPSLKHGIDLDLPKVTPQQLDTEANTLTIVITKPAAEGFTENIYIRDERVDLADLERIVSDERSASPDMDFVLEVDRSARYDMFAQVLARLKSMGIDNVGLVTEPIELKH